MQYLTAALGIITSQGQTIAYASRLAFEVYRSEAHTDYYFRVVYNGKDVTQQIDFCEGGQILPDQTWTNFGGDLRQGCGQGVQGVHVP